MNVFPYVYKVVNRITGEFYIGYREANKLPAEKDILNYKTSSAKVKPNFSDFDPYIIAEFFTETARDDAYWFEQNLIAEHISNPLCLNGYYIKKGYKKFKSKKGKKCKDLTKQKISKTKNTIDPNTGLTNAQKGAINSVATKKQNNSYEDATKKANETKIKNNSNIIGGKKSSQTKNKIDSVTGLTASQLAGIKISKTKNTIDPMTGLTNAQKSALKMKETKNTIDSITGLTRAQLAGLKLKKTLQKIDPESGLTVKEIQAKKASETLKKNRTLSRDKHPNAKHIQIFDNNGILRYDCNGTFIETCKRENLSYKLLIASANTGKPITNKKSPFYGWYVILLNRT